MLCVVLLYWSVGTTMLAELESSLAMMVFGFVVSRGGVQYPLANFGGCRQSGSGVDWVWFEILFFFFFCWLGSKEVA